MRRSAAALLILSAALSACAQPEAITAERTEEPMPASVRNISVTEARGISASGNALLIDVRRAKEWDDTGTAEGAIGITLQDSDFVQQVLAATGGDKTRPVALICRSGSRSKTAARKLDAAGFTTLLNVEGGTLDWKKQGLPVEACKTC